MISRREFLQAGVAATALTGFGGGWSRAVAQQAMTEDALTDMPPVGNVTLMHITDIHAQLKPIYFREPSINIGVGELLGKPILKRIRSDRPYALLLDGGDTWQGSYTART